MQEKRNQALEENKIKGLHVKMLAAAFFFNLKVDICFVINLILFYR